MKQKQKTADYSAVRMCRQCTEDYQSGQRAISQAAEYLQEGRLISSKNALNFGIKILKSAMGCKLIDRSIKTFS